MNKEVHLKISQLLDNELHSEEEEMLLKQIRKQPELKNKMSRYHLMSQVLKTDEFVFADHGFVDKINQQLQQEPSYLIPKRQTEHKNKGFWYKSTLAIAASILLVTILVNQTAEQAISEHARGPQLVAQNQIGIEKNQVKGDKKPLTRHEQLKAYLAAHSDDLYTHGSIGYIPYARVANYGQE